MPSRAGSGSAALASLSLLEAEADAVVCPRELDPFGAVGLWYESFEQVEDEDVKRLFAFSGRAAALAGPPPSP